MLNIAYFIFYGLLASENTYRRANNMQISEKLFKQAVNEMKSSILVGLDGTIDLNKQELSARVSIILQERIESILSQNNGFEERMNKATITGHIDSLRKGHLKGLKHQLKQFPEVEKDTAKQIVHELFKTEE